MKGRRAVFVDRDGTIVGERHYLADPADVALVPGAPEALLRMRAAGLALVLVTNQSGIGRGLYGLEDYLRVKAEVDRQLAHAGVVMDGTYYCPDAPGMADLEATCRKPSPVMYRKAAVDLGLETRDSYYVGDKMSDVLPAGVFGGTGILVRTGYGKEEEGRLAEREGALAGMYRVVDDLTAAADLIDFLEGGRFSGAASVDPVLPSR